MALTVLITYDISADHTRAQVAAYLQQWGDRIQRVFICAIAPDDLDQVNTTLATMIDPNTDAIHLLPACATCWSRLQIHGQAERHPDQPLLGHTLTTTGPGVVAAGGWCGVGSGDGTDEPVGQVVELVLDAVEVGGQGLGFAFGLVRG